MTPVGSSVQYTCDETSVTVQLISGVSIGLLAWVQTDVCFILMVCIPQASPTAP